MSYVVDVFGTAVKTVAAAIAFALMLAAITVGLVVTGVAGAASSIRG